MISVDCYPGFLYCSSIFSNIKLDLIVDDIFGDRDGLEIHWNVIALDGRIVDFLPAFSLDRNACTDVYITSLRPELSHSCGASLPNEKDIFLSTRFSSSGGPFRIFIYVYSSTSCRGVSFTLPKSVPKKEAFAKNFGIVLCGNEDPEI